MVNFSLVIGMAKRDILLFNKMLLFFHLVDLLKIGFIFINHMPTTDGHNKTALTFSVVFALEIPKSNLNHLTLP